MTTRNRGLVAPASIAVLALIAGSVAATLDCLRANAAEQTARQEAGTARQVSEFIVGLFESSDSADAQGRDVSAREELDRGVARIDETPAGSPAVQANLLGSMASVDQSLGLLESAETLTSRALTLRVIAHFADIFLPLFRTTTQPRSRSRRALRARRFSR